MKLAYIVGPFRGSSHWMVAENIHAARRVSLAAAYAGYMPVCPHSNTSEFDGVEGIPGSFWLEGTLEMMRRCDVVVLCDGWEKSDGSIEEIKEALKMGKPVGFIYLLPNGEQIHGWHTSGIDGTHSLIPFKQAQLMQLQYVFIEASSIAYVRGELSILR